MKLLRFAVLALAPALLLVLSATSSRAAESAQTKIARALSAGPASVTANATVVDMNKGKATVLRKGTNDFTCIPGHPGVVGDDPMCLDGQSMQWAKDWMSHKPRPTNTKPGIAYMFAGGTDYSMTDPWGKPGPKVYKTPPHWMLLWPVDPKASGLPSTFQTTGTFVMFPGTPYAHLMLIGKP
jgi:hypothetical protein